MLSHVNYCISCWGYGSMTRLEKLQKKAVRIVTKSKYNAHTNPLFKLLNCLKINDIFKTASLKIYHKFHNETVPFYFENFPFKSIANTMDMRPRRQRIMTLRYRDSTENLPVTNPVIEHVSSEKQLSRNRVKYLVPHLINTAYIPEVARVKVETHSFASFNNYIKNIIIESYLDECLKPDCYICKPPIK